MDNLKARITAAVAAIYAATTIEALYEHYKAEVGYSPADDGDARDMETLRGDLIDYHREACYAAGIPCAEVGIRTDVDAIPALAAVRETLRAGPPPCIGYSGQTQAAFAHGWRAAMDRIYGELLNNHAAALKAAEAAAGA